MSTAAIVVLAIVSLIAGVANASPPQAIVGGSVAAPAEFPYQVSVRYANRHMCGGAIISKKHILTAAHCVATFDRKLFRIAFGSNSVDGGDSYRVANIVYHPQYSVGVVGSPNDIAVMTLKRSIQFDENKNKIDLPPAPTPSDATAIATGWGLTSVTSRGVAADLMKVQLRTLSNSECQRYFFNRVNIYGTQICTLNGRGLGTCKGDSGGPLASADGHLIGIVSWGIPCALGLPDVYTSVYHYVSWIEQVMKKK